MKHIYLTICLLFSVSSFAQFGEIPNGGFENWTTTTIYDYPTQWINSNTHEYSGIPTIFKSTDANTGNYSCELMVGFVPPSDTNISYVVHGNIGSMGPDAGIPYSDVFDEVRFQYKSELPLGDTVYMLYMRFSGGTMVEMNLLPAINGTAGTWTQGSISVPNTAQDSLFIGFVTGDPFSGPRPTPGAWARIDDVKLLNTGTPVTDLPDPSFEDWSTVSVENVDVWVTMNDMLAGAGLENATKSTDANSGNFSLELITQTNFNMDTIPGFLSMGPMNFGVWNPFFPAPYTANPTNFSGAYKYAPNNSDQAWVEIEFLQGGASIGYHFEQLNAAASWMTFNSALTITGTPDSMRFVASSGINPGSTLLLDDLQFSGGNVGLEEFEMMDISIYPNPAREKVFVKSKGEYSIMIYDLLGDVKFESSMYNGTLEIDLTKYESGTYIILIHNEDNIETHKLIIE